MGGKVTKPKIQAYVEQDVYDWFKGFCDGRGLNQSQGLNLALSKLTKLIEFDSAVESASESAVSDSTAFSKLTERVETLTDCYISLEKLVMNRLREVEGRLERGEQVNDLGLDESASESQAELAREIPDAQIKITQAKLLAADIKLTEAELATRIGMSERSLQRWKMKPEDEFNEWLDKHEPAPNLIWKPIPNTKLFQAALKPLPLENSFGEPVDPSLEYRYNAAIKAIEELAQRE